MNNYSEIQTPNNQNNFSPIAAEKTDIGSKNLAFFNKSRPKSSYPAHTIGQESANSRLKNHITASKKSLRINDIERQDTLS